MANKSLTVGKNYNETEEEAAIRILQGFSFDDFDGYKIMNNRVVMVIYTEPTHSKGGIIISEGRRAEAIYQGKCGLIVGLGPSAYRDDSGQWFRGDKPKIGDWVVIDANDGRRINLFGIECRTFDDTLTWMIVPHPESVW